MAENQKLLRDFLKEYPPFNLLPAAELDKLSEHCKMRHGKAGEQLFRVGEAHLDHFFVVRDGSVEMCDHSEEDGSDRLIDLCDEGDVFGVAALIANRNYIVSAKTVEDSTLIEISWSDFEPLLHRHPSVSLFFVAGFASGLPFIHNDAKKQYQAGRQLSVVSTSRRRNSFNEDAAVIKLSKREVLSCSGDLSIRAAAQKMSELRAGSIVVINEHKWPIGIVTDSDFRKKVVAKDISRNQPVSEIMSAPVLTYSPKMTVAEAIIAMMRDGVRHLCLTESGGAESPIAGLVSQHDLMLSHGNSPAVLVKELVQTEERSQLAAIRDRAEELLGSYLDQGISVLFISDMISAINDTLIRRSIELAWRSLLSRGDLTPPPEGHSWAWLSLGSEGRREQLLRTDQDNAIVYADVAAAERESVAAWYMELGKEVTDSLAAAGFVYCPAEIMASNPEWNQPLSAWNGYFSKWIRQPTEKAVMNTTIFFDFHAIYGDSSLASQMRDHIHGEIDRNSIFLSFLARNALQNPPPLSFFRNFMVERSGEHKNQFDIKSRGMMPLADAARVLSLDHKIQSVTSTTGRYQKIGEIEPRMAELCSEASMAYQMLMRLRAINGLEKSDSGRFFDPEALTKMERQSLRNAFRTIQEIQEVVKVRYQVSMLGS